MKRALLTIGATLAVVAVAAFVALQYVTPIKMMTQRAAPYFSYPSATHTEFYAFGDDLYAYQDHMETAFIIRTNEGLVVVDPFNAEFAKRLKALLDERFPNEPITHLIYSHHHLDHTRGGHVLEPQKVVAHENTRWHFERVDPAVALHPTTYLPAGDRTFEVGDRRIRLIDFDHAHGEHLYGFFFPQQRLLYGPDLAFCRTLPPFGFPDFNHHGHVESLDRAARLEFDRFVPSHFALGDRSCVEEFAQLFRDGREALQDAIARHGPPSDNANADWFEAVLIDALRDLEPKYASWQGYDEMGLSFVMRQLSGSYIGF